MIPSSELIERIRKLLALSASSNEHEAAAAAAKAQELLFKHNLDMATIETVAKQDRIEYGVRWFPKMTSGLIWKRGLIQAIAHANFCHALWRRSDITLVGEPHNVEFCAYLHDYLVREIRRLARQSYDADGWWRTVNRSAYEHSFSTGAAVTITRRLMAQLQQDEATSADSRALVVIKDVELRAAVARFFPDVKTNTRRVRPVLRSRAAFSAGVEAGQDLSLERPIARQGDRRTSLPGRPDTGLAARRKP